MIQQFLVARIALHPRDLTGLFINDFKVCFIFIHHNPMITNMHPAVSKFGLEKYFSCVNIDPRVLPEVTCNL
jgi:hypothetical protein